jgi:hypothetical protein
MRVREKFSLLVALDRARLSDLLIAALSPVNKSSWARIAALTLRAHGPDFIMKSYPAIRIPTLGGVDAHPMLASGPG